MGGARAFGGQPAWLRQDSCTQAQQGEPHRACFETERLGASAPWLNTALLGGCRRRCRPNLISAKTVCMAGTTGARRPGFWVRDAKLNHILY